MPEEAIRVFYSYSRKDLDMRNTLEDHLSALREAGKISTWHDLELEAGTEWEPAILDKLDTADIILLLVSRSFIASKYCYDTELKRAIARHHEGTARVIPIILRPCDWNHSDVPFSKLNVLPTHAEPITKWADPEEAFAIVAQRIRETVDQLRAKKATERQQQIKPPSDTSNVSRVVKVRVHRAFFVSDITQYYFINLTNISPSRSVEVTHIWYQDEDGHHIPVIEPSRMLPVRLDLEQSWETWIAVDELPIDKRENAYQNFYARLSTGDIFRSEANPNIPPHGIVPGGPIQILPVQQGQEEVERLELLRQQVLKKQQETRRRQSAQTVSTNELASEKGVDYTRLRDLLKAGQWKEADQETIKLMEKVMGRRREGYVRAKDIESFPCTDLHTINRLWTRYSSGKFGFDVQKRIWKEVQGDYRTFSRSVGWILNEEVVDLNLVTDVPEGYLPSLSFNIDPTYLKGIQESKRIDSISTPSWLWKKYIFSLFVVRFVSCSSSN